MEKYNECWLPNIEPCNDFAKYDEYIEHIYSIFRHDFIETTTIYNNAIVDIDHDIGPTGKEKGFEHVITNDFEKNRKRYPDFKRSERIRWIKAFIENYNCRLGFDCNDAECDGIKIWTKQKGKHIRTLFLFEEESFLVVIEQKRTWYVLITSYYIDQDHTMRKLISEYEKTKTK